MKIMNILKITVSLLSLFMLLQSSFAGEKFVNKDTTSNSLKKELYFATIIEDNASILELIQKGVDPNKRYNQSAILPLEITESIETTKLLLQNGAKIEVYNQDSNSLLHQTIFKNNALELLKILLENGANAKVINNKGENLLHWAVMRAIEKKNDPQNINIIRLLLDNGVSKTQKDNSGFSPKELAQQNNITLFE